MVRRRSLRLRGYTETILGPIFAAAPPYESRAALMEPKPPTESARSHCLMLDFSVALQRLNLRRLQQKQMHWFNVWLAWSERRR